MYDFKFPDVGEGITEGEIVKWHVREGQEVKEHDILVEVETDKAIVELPSPKSGTVLGIRHREGDTVKVGEVLVTIGEKGEKPPAAPAPAAQEAAARPAARPAEKKPEFRPAGVVGYLEEAPEEEVPAPAARAPPPKPAAPVTLATPAVRRLARELGVSLEGVGGMEGTGLGGRITEEDVRQAAAKAKAPAPAAPSAAKIVKREYDLYGYVERVALRGVRKATAKKMVKSLYTAPHVTHIDEADVTLLVEHREREKVVAQERGVHLTFLPFIIKAVIAALKKHPYLNALLDDEHEEILLKRYYNIGVAVDTPDGLIVPVIKGADQKSLLDLAKEIEDIAGKAMKRSLDLADLKGGTFTITNIGVIGGIFATPIINWPEVAILATGRINEKPAAVKGKIEIRKFLPLSLAFDHRVLDGAAAARFVNDIKIYLEDPDRLMLEED